MILFACSIRKVKLVEGWLPRIGRMRMTKGEDAGKGTNVYLLDKLALETKYATWQLYQ